MVVIVWLLLPSVAVTQEPSDVALLITQLNAADKRERTKAAEALAEIDDTQIASALRKRVTVETDYNVKLALHYALALQGEKQALAFMIDSLARGEHLGYLMGSRPSV